MANDNPFKSILALEPIEADLAPRVVSDVSYSDIVSEASGWLPSEIVDAFSILESDDFDTSDMAKNLSVILALLRGELKTRQSIRRWFATGQIEISQGQTVYLSRVSRLARDVVKFSTKIVETNKLKREKSAEFRGTSGKRQEKVGATVDRLEDSISRLETKRINSANEFDQLIGLVADYMGVGRTK